MVLGSGEVRQEQATKETVKAFLISQEKMSYSGKSECDGVTDLVETKEKPDQKFPFP